VAKVYGGLNASKQVAYAWALTLGEWGEKQETRNSGMGLALVLEGEGKTQQEKNTGSCDSCMHTGVHSLPP
jgi:hypothetical protein